MKKKLVISAINFTEGGPLTILQDSIESAIKYLGDAWEIIVLANSRNVICQKDVTVYEFPISKKSWIVRLYYEWFYFMKISKKIEPDLWLSLHDITPRVKAYSQAVYCHNPSPFYNVSIREGFLDPTFFIFCLFYGKIYKANIRKNKYVIVQQDWLRKEFINKYNVPNVIVAHPSRIIEQSRENKRKGKKYVFLFPAFPRVFKNFEIIGEAIKLLENNKCSGYEVQITINGKENRYSRMIYQKYSMLKELKFVGRQDKKEMQIAYANCSAVIFPSKLETWGLPITEAISCKKILIVSDLPYAHETVGCYTNVAFFKPNNAKALADIMQSILEGRWFPVENEYEKPEEPYAKDWEALWSILSK